MPMYRVVCYHGAAEWDGDKFVEADSAGDAARKVCGEGLITRGEPGDLRAQVAEVSNPSIIVVFFNPPSAA